MVSPTKNGTKSCTEEAGVPESANTSLEGSNNQDDMVRRINQELAEFRQQLKKSQELFHALVSSCSLSFIDFTFRHNPYSIIQQSVGGWSSDQYS